MEAHEKHNVDHKIAAKNIHDDKARAGLAEISGVAWGQPGLKSGPYAGKRPKFEKISELKEKEAHERLTDKECQTLTK
ncbi:hypothetical protein GL297_14660 [Komagataeibacter sp. FXV2]|nr:hypothetical protein [Komagataeibacter sp. FXV2]